MHQCGMFLPLSPLCILVFIVCQTQCSTPVHHVCISVTSRFFQVFHTPLFWCSGIAARFCCPASNPAVPSCLYLFIGVVTSFAINTNFAVWILGMHFYWDRGSTSFLFFSFLFWKRIDWDILSATGRGRERRCLGFEDDSDRQGLLTPSFLHMCYYEQNQNIYIMAHSSLAAAGTCTSNSAWSTWLHNARWSIYRIELERLARRCRAITCSPVISMKVGNVFRGILGYGLIYRNFSVLLLS